MARDKIEDKQVFIKLNPKQEEFFKIVLSGKYKHVLFGGAVAGSKTVAVLMLLCLLCKAYPKSRWVIIRKDGPVLERNTLPSFWKFCPKPFFHPSRFNGKRLEATASNGSQIIFMSENIARDKQLTAFDGLEVNGAVMEECHELSEDLDLKLADRVGRWSIEPMPPLLHLYTCNPTQNWVKRVFYTPHSNGTLPDNYYFLQALPRDNPNLPQAYLDALEDLKKRAPNLYSKRVQGSWDAEDDIQQLVSWEKIWACENLIEFTEEDEIYRSMGVDVGRHGSDASVWYILEGNYEKGYNIIHKEKFDKTDGPQVGQKTKELIIEWEVPHHRVFFDIVGLGGFEYDHILDDGYNIQGFSGGSTGDEQFNIEHPDINQKQLFSNMNSKAGWEMKVLMDDEKIGGLTSQTLRDDIAVYRYDIKGEKMIEIWGKNLIKKELHRSPDDGDAFKYAVWGAIYDKVGLVPEIHII